MFASAETVPHGCDLRADVCVIGAGAAGLVLAKELLGSRLRVCLLESGTIGKAAKEDPYYELETTGLPIAHDSRVRAFGGTTTAWSGRWKRLEPIDFERRDWVPLSGWPLTREDLDPYYDRADAIVGMPPPPAAHSPFESEMLEATVFQTQRRSDWNWGTLLQSQLEHAPNVDTYLDAHAVRLESEDGAVRHVSVRSPGGNAFSVTCGAVVLAAGGIENARMLLLSDIGNETGQVGRCYMDHPKGRLGIVETYGVIDASAWKGGDGGSLTGTGLRLAEAEQRRHGLLDSRVLLEPVGERSLPIRVARRLAGGGACRVIALGNEMEQAPDPENRVTLSDRLDPLGNPLARVHWTIGELDMWTMVVFHKLLRAEFQRLGVGELDSALLDPRTAEFPINKDSSHHMGTTRMGDDQATSVVDRDCRVHGTQNLFVAGGSVFPTAGFADPAATIAALAVRLADHLKTAL